MKDEICVVTDGASTTIYLTGEVDLSRVGEAETAVLVALEGAPEWVVVDLSGVTFLDSSGLKALVSARRVAEARGVDFFVAAAMQPAVERVFKVAGLRAVFDAI